jgi:hypothetical protein
MAVSQATQCKGAGSVLMQSGLKIADDLNATVSWRLMDAAGLTD